VIVLVGGGSRSGKSRYALDRARRVDGPRVYIATAETFDTEMRDRASAHRAERGGDFVTLEEPIELTAAIRAVRHEVNAIVIDCLTLWVSNLMLAGRDVFAETAAMLEAAKNHPATVVLVSNEVGCGIVPENELARRFRDLAGFVNQQTAAEANEVWWMAFGCPLQVK
jgi:adenosylcobinamide kinase/adenosylcobinamide-phosphate guanylyltransferase